MAASPLVTQREEYAYYDPEGFVYKVNKKCATKLYLRCNDNACGALANVRLPATEHAIVVTTL